MTLVLALGEARCVLAWLCDEVVNRAKRDDFKDDAWIPMMAQFHVTCLPVASACPKLEFAIQCWNGLKVAFG